jgi:hypothetical protein
MSFRRLSTAHSANEVWSPQPIAVALGSKLDDLGEPFTEFTVPPGEGVNPPEGAEAAVTG